VTGSPAGEQRHGRAAGGASSGVGGRRASGGGRFRRGEKEQRRRRGRRFLKTLFSVAVSGAAENKPIFGGCVSDRQK
jgi:hypothetical protein